uniref:Retrovirus-related Pol polyprotein from transposon TNT 1-94 n=1 Tax=Cajanus cajan TaxID=3821 RepID=A0A151TXZ8_CAJCA|nr:Retrovirus-related Pol polyprotein from transposon TNT 1-94 [Cajanus cajan]
MNFFRPDIVYAVSRLSIFTQNPNEDHWDALARLMRYLKDTMDYGIIYSGFSFILERYSDANWISYSNKTKFTSGYVFALIVVQINQFAPYM